MKINYAYVDPGGNPTVLVLDKISRTNQPGVARKIMESSKLPCEQVGFFEAAQNPKAVLRLQMMGGEFCGNALRATAAFLSSFSFSLPLVRGSRRGLTSLSPSSRGGELSYVLQSSGTMKLIKTSVTKDGDFIWAETEVPLSSSKMTKLDYLGMIRVDLEGITHFFLPEKYYPKREQILNWLTSLEISADAYGLIFYEQVAKKNFSIVPVVFVRKTNTLVYETSCASGSVALAVAKKKNIKAIQPSGYSLDVAVSEGKALIGGLIKSIKLGQMNI